MKCRQMSVVCRWNIRSMIEGFIGLMCMWDFESFLLRNIIEEWSTMAILCSNSTMACMRLRFMR